MRNSRIVRANIPAQNTRLPLIGKIRIGEKRTNSAGKEYPVSLDYFIATGSYASKFDEVYQKPERIQVIFISDDDFQSCFEEWDGRDTEGRRAGYGDGVKYYLWEYGKNQYKETQDRNEVTEFSKRHNVKWKQVLTINFVIPAIKGVFGVWQLQTSGDKSSINAIRNTFDEIKELAGTVVNIPFDLVVKKVTSNKPEAKSVYPVISLVPNISAENMEVLRGYLNAGLDIKRQGILSEEKLTALEAHEPPKLKQAGTALDAAASTVAFKADLKESDGLKKAIGDSLAPEYIAKVSRLIKQCRTVQELQELHTLTPVLADRLNDQLETLWDDRYAELTGHGEAT